MRASWLTLLVILTLGACSAQQAGVTTVPSDRRENRQVRSDTAWGIVEIQTEFGLTGSIASDLAGNEWTGGDNGQGRQVVIAINEQTEKRSVFDLPAPGGEPVGFALDAQHAKMWFTVPNVDYVESFDLTTHAFRQFKLQHNARAGGITAGPDGAMWFTEPRVHPNTTGQIGRIDLATSARSEFTLPAHLRAWQIALGEDGALWFTATTGASSGSIGRITTGGEISNYPIGSNVPRGITTGPDGAIWFAGTSDSSGSLIGRIDLYTHTRRILKYAPYSGGNVGIATRGSDLWLTSYDKARIDSFDPATHTIAHHNLPAGYVNPDGIALGSDNQLWFTNFGSSSGAFGKLCPQETQQQCSTGS